MIRLDPCCGASLQRGVKIASILNMMTSAISIGIYLFMLGVSISRNSSHVQFSAHEPHPNGPEYEHYHHLPDPPQNLTSGRDVNANGAPLSIWETIVQFGRPVWETIIFILVNMVDFILAIFLYKGAQKECLKKCRIYFWVFLVLFVLHFANSINELVLRGASWEVVLGLLMICFEPYILWIVYEFMRELEETQKRFSTLSSLTMSPRL